MVIQFPRGDSYRRGFILKNKKTGEPITERFSEVYFTAKRAWMNNSYVLQKRMTSGGISEDGEGHYTLYIAPEDTNDLDFGEYDFDIEFVKEGIKKTFVGKLRLEKEVTYQSNE